MSHKALIKIGRLVTADVINGGPARADISLYQRGALRLFGDAPVLIDHDDSRPVGRVLGLFEAPDTDGDWLWARCSIDRAPDWLKRGTKASVGFVSVFRGGMRGWSWIHRGLVTEVPILHDLQPAEPLAHVALVERSNGSSGAGSDRLAPGDVVIHDFSDHEMERMIAAADRRRGQPGREPGVLVRPGIGKVLGVR